MFPVAAIKAVRDLRPTDGDLTTLKLGIYNEIRAPRQLYPSNLTVESTYFDRRAAGERTEIRKYKLQCEFL